MSDVSKAGRLRIYACGGGGTNIVAGLLENTGTEAQPNYASLHPVYIDTSRSNLKAGIDETNSYLLQDLDGSGMLRRENYSAIDNVVKEILHLNKPMDFNIVVFMAAGGSGSVIGPLLIGELLARDEPLIAIVIGGDESEIATKNSLNTLKSLDGISSNLGKPVVTFYRQNTRNQSRRLVDDEIALAISALAILVSRHIQELDSQDIFNFINYHRVTNSAPAVAGLVLVGDEPGEMDKAAPVSVITIRKDPDEPTIEHIPGFLKSAYADLSMGSVKNLFYGVDTSEPTKWAKALQSTLDRITQASEARPTANRLSADTDVKTNKGMVL